MRRVRVVIADRRPIVLQGFASLLAAQPDFEVVACCLDGTGCLTAVRRLAPDVALLEDGFTDVTASDMLAIVDDEGLPSRLVFFTASVACGDLAKALATGACSAISMSAKPEALVQSLRLERSGSDLARVGNEASGRDSFGNNVLALLTVNERTIMDLVAEGLSNVGIARVLGVSPDIVGIHLDHVRQKLGIRNRTELAALALARRYGAISTLAAVILAALDDAADAHHTATESFTVMAADGSAELVTIKISRKEAVSGGNSAKASKDRGVVNGAAGTPTLNSKVFDLGANESSLDTLTLTAVSSPRASLSSYFMAVAAGAVIYELAAANSAQALDLGNSLTGVASSAASSNVEWAALPDIEAIISAFFNSASERTFAFETGGGNVDFPLFDADPTADSSIGSTVFSHARPAITAYPSQSIHEGPGSVNVPKGGTSQYGNSDETATSSQGISNGGDDFPPGHSQKALHASDNSFGAAKGHAKHDAPGDDLNHGQSQKALHASDNSFGAAKGHAEHGAPGDDLNHGQSQKALHASDNSFGAAKGHAKHETPDHGAPLQHAGASGPHGTQTAPVNAQSNSQSNFNAALQVQPPSNDANQAEPLKGEDSFHFKKTANKVSDDFNIVSHGIKPNSDGQPADEGKSVPFPDADEMGVSASAHQHGVHHPDPIGHHAAHDLIV